MELTQETPAPTITKQRSQATHSLVLRASSHLVKRYYFALADNEVVEWNREGLSPQGRLRRRCREGAAGMGGRGGGRRGTGALSGGRSAKAVSSLWSDQSNSSTKGQAKKR